MIATGYVFMSKDVDISKLDVNTIAWTYKDNIYDNIKSAESELIKTSKIFGLNKNRMKIVKINIQMEELDEKSKCVRN